MYIHKFMEDEMSKLMALYKFPVGNDKVERYARSHKLFNLLILCMATICILQHLYEAQKLLKVCLLLNRLILPH